MQRLSRTLAAIVLLGLGPVVSAQPPGAPRVELPTGNGKAEVEAACVACHQTNLIVGSTGYSEEGWRYLTGQMIKLTAALASTVAGYLATNFPPRPGRRRSSCRATRRSRSRSGRADARPAAARSAANGRRHDLVGGHVREPVGRLNPATGEMREYRLDPTRARTASSTIARQHLVHGQRQRHGRQARSGDRRDQGLPDARCGARDPHTPIFDARAICGSRCRTATWSAGSSRPRARSSS